MHIISLLKKVLIGLTVSCSIGACTSDNSSDIHLKDGVERIELSPATRAVADEISPSFVRYTTDVIKHSLENDESASKLVTSPLSATMLMALVANGIEDESRKEITEYLGTDDIESLNELCKTLLNGLPKADFNVTVDLANSIWVNKFFGLSPNQNYLSILYSYFNGQSFNYDFDDERERFTKELKNWYSYHTNGLVCLPEEIIRPGDGRTMAILLNSIYFKAPWDSFPPKNTKKGVFYTATQPVMVDMMNSYPISGSPYYKDENFEVFGLTFFETSYMLYVILPSSHLSLRSAVDKITPDFIKAVEEEMTDCTLTVSMPKFHIETSLYLNPVLSDAGVNSFMDGENFTMFNTSLPSNTFVEVFQNTSFDLNEKGAETATVTGAQIEISDYVGLPERKIDVNVNRPFVFFIKEKVSGAWLTSGFFATPD